MVLANLRLGVGFGLACKRWNNMTTNTTQDKLDKTLAEETKLRAAFDIVIK